MSVAVTVLHTVGTNAAGSCMLRLPAVQMHPRIPERGVLAPNINVMHQCLCARGLLYECWVDVLLPVPWLSCDWRTVQCRLAVQHVQRLQPVVKPRVVLPTCTHAVILCGELFAFKQAPQEACRKLHTVAPLVCDLVVQHDVICIIVTTLVRRLFANPGDMNVPVICAGGTSTLSILSTNVPV